MKRTTLFIEESMERDLRALAGRLGKSAAALVRQAVGEFLVSQQREMKLGFLGAGHSGRSDIAERHEELLFSHVTPHSLEGPQPTASEEKTADQQAPGAVGRKPVGP